MRKTILYFTYVITEEVDLFRCSAQMVVKDDRRDLALIIPFLRIGTHCDQRFVMLLRATMLLPLVRVGCAELMLPDDGKANRTRPSVADEMNNGTVIAQFLGRLEHF